MVEPPCNQSRAGLSRKEDKQTFIAMHSKKFLRKSVSISAIFNQNMRATQQYIRDFSEKLEVVCLDIGGRVGMKKRESGLASSRAFAQKHLFTCSLTLRAEGMLNTWKLKQIVMTGATCMRESPRVRSKVGMRSRDDRPRVLEIGL